MAELTPADHEDRLKAMTEPDQQTWDLSRNDVKALAWALAELARLRAENARLDGVARAAASAWEGSELTECPGEDGRG